MFVDERTCNLSPGLVVPIPTFPSDVTLAFSEVPVAITKSDPPTVYTYALSAYVDGADELPTPTAAFKVPELSIKPIEE